MFTIIPMTANGISLNGHDYKFKILDMKTEITINEKEINKDYFPSLFSNKDKTIIILADARTAKTTFSGMVIHSINETKKGIFGTYSTGWTYQQFTRLAKGSEIILKINQED